MKPETIISPYPGPRSFNEDEALYFKGRDNYLQDIANKLSERHFLMVTGASGDGKSSLIFAGLLPHARAGLLKAKYARWTLMHFRPKRDPLLHLAEAVNEQLKLNDLGKVTQKLKLGFSSLVDLYKTSTLFNEDRKKGSNLIILADQFEEFFTNEENFNTANAIATPQSQLTVQLLLETVKVAREEKLPVFVVFTMRSDYFGHCSALQDLPDMMVQSQLFIKRLGRQQMLEAIREPALLSGIKISERLLQTLMMEISSDIGTDMLPILQHCLSQIFRAAKNGAEEMDLIHYAMIGGIGKEALPEEHKQKFEKWFDALDPKDKKDYKNPSLRNVLDLHANKLYHNPVFIRSQDGKTENLIQIEKHIAQRIIHTAFKCLTRMDEGKPVRNLMSLGEITDMIGDPKIDYALTGSVLNLFREQGNTFLNPPITKDKSSENLKPDSVLDITHEALMRNWNKLEQWAQEEYGHVITYRELCAQLNKWIASGKNKANLLSAGNLIYFERWFKGQEINPLAWFKRYYDFPMDESIPPDELILQHFENLKDYLKTSRIQINRKKTIAQAAVAVICLCLIAALGGLFYSQMLKEGIVKTAHANEIATKAYTLLEHDPTLAFRLAEQSYIIEPTPLNQQVIMAAYAQMPFYKKLEGHTERVCYAAWSPDGKYIVTASYDKSALLRNMDGSIIATLKHEGPFMVQTEAAVFSPNGKYLLTYAVDSTARIWDMDGTQLAVLKHNHEYVWSCFSEDGGRILTNSYDKTVRIWDKTGREILRLDHKHKVKKALFMTGTEQVITLTGNLLIWDSKGKLVKEIEADNAFNQVEVSNRKDMVVAGDVKGGFYGWDKNGNVLFFSKQHESYIVWIDFSPDDEHIVTGDGNGLISLWNKKGEFLAHLRGHSSIVWMVKFSPDGSRIASCSDDGTSKIWNLEGTTLMTLKGHASQVLSINWNPDGKKIITASADKTNRIWEVEPKENPLFTGHKGYVRDAVFSPDGNTLTTAGRDHTARIWDKSGKEIRSLLHSYYAITQSIISSRLEIYTANYYSGNLIRFSKEGIPLDTFKHKNGVQQFGMEVSKDAGQIVSLDMAGNGYLWDSAGYLIQKFEGHLLQMISGNTNRLITISRDSSLYLWKQGERKDSMRYQKYIQLHTHPEKSRRAAFTSVQFSSDEKWLITLSEDSTIRIWDGEEILNSKLEIQKPGTETIEHAPIPLKEIKVKAILGSVVFSPVENIFITASDDNIMRLYNTQGKLLAEYIGHGDGITDVNFSHNGKLLVSSSIDKSVRLWNLVGMELMNYPGHKAAVTKARFSADDKYILSASYDHTARLMPVTVEQVLDKINREKVRGDVWEIGKKEKEAYGIGE